MKKRHIAIVIDLEWPLKHHHEVFAGAQRFADEHDWECTVWPHLPQVSKLGLVYDGIIGRITPELAQAGGQAGIPIVNTWVSSPVQDVPTVKCDAAAGARMAAEHLMARGFARFGFLGYRRVRDSREWQIGFRDALKAAGYSCEIQLVSSQLAEGLQNWTRFQDELQEWVARLQPPVAVFNGSDFLARYVANEAKSLGLRIPEDLALIGQVNEIAVCRKPEPTLTSIELGFERVGYAAAQLLEELMEGAPPPSEPVLLPPVEVVPRQSTDGFVVDDPLVAQALGFIMEHCHTGIKVRDVVAHLPASTRTLERRFHQLRGHTIIEEITRLRLERVKRLLVETELPVKEIAANSGYTDAAQLCTSFRKAEGITPGAYRTEHAGAPRGRNFQTQPGAETQPTISK